MIAANNQEETRCVNPPVKQLKPQTQCGYCGKWVRYMKSHLQIHRLTPITCEACNKSFKSQSGYRRHRISHCNHLRCQHCKQTFPDQETLEAHLEEHKEHSQECPFCAKLFGATRHLKVHVKNVHKCTVIFRCLKCDFTTPQFHLYESHVAVHAKNVKLYGCNHCKFVSGKRSVCRTHINTSHDVTETCVTCKGDFRNIFDLQDHNLKVHDNWKCERCGRMCKTLGAYNRHLRHHRVKKRTHVYKPLICPICNKDFYHMKKIYRKHLLEHKLSTSSFKCEYCIRVFSREKALEYHIDHMHKFSDGFLCLSCNYSTQSSEDYKTHISSHNDVQK